MSAGTTSEFGHPLRKFKLVFLGEQSGNKKEKKKNKRRGKKKEEKKEKNEI